MKKITDQTISKKAQEMAMAELGRKISENDVRLFSILNKAQNGYNFAGNKYFDEEMEEILVELDSRGHISYDRKENTIKVKRSFYDFMVELLNNSPDNYKVR
jgi:hypothetical protein